MSTNGTKDPSDSASAHYRRLTKLFLSVVDLGKAERKAALHRGCRRFPALRSELELLLRIHDGCAAGDWARKRGPGDRGSSGATLAGRA